MSKEKNVKEGKTQQLLFHCNHQILQISNCRDSLPWYWSESLGYPVWQLILLLPGGCGNLSSESLPFTLCDPNFTLWEVLSVHSCLQLHLKQSLQNVLYLGLLSFQKEYLCYRLGGYCAHNYTVKGFCQIPAPPPPLDIFSFKLKTDLLSKGHGNRFSPEASKRNTVLPTTL